MIADLADSAVRRLRLRANRLHRPEGRTGPAGVLELVRHLGGVQAQSTLGAALAIRARTRGTTYSHVTMARTQERSVVRAWFMRGTLHLVPAADVGWLLQLFGEMMTASTRRRYRELGLDDELSRRAVDTIERAVLADGPLTRRDIAERLAAAGLLRDTAGQQVIHLIRRASLEGRLCYGPDRGSDETWVSLHDWLGAVPDRVDDLERAATELAWRYLAGHEPATVADFATWSGLPMPVARRAFGRLGDRLTEVRVGAEAAAMLSAVEMNPAEEEVRLLGEFDPYLLGYRSRSFAVSDRYARAVHPGGGMLRRTVIEDGWAVGTWTLDRGRHPPTVSSEPFDPSRPLNIDAEAADVARFLTG